MNSTYQIASPTAEPFIKINMGAWDHDCYARNWTFTIIRTGQWNDDVERVCVVETDGRITRALIEATVWEIAQRTGVAPAYLLSLNAEKNVERDKLPGLCSAYWPSKGRADSFDKALAESFKRAGVRGYKIMLGGFGCVAANGAEIKTNN